MKYFYDVSEWNDVEAVKERALESVGRAVCETPFKDPLHFAMWCKTGRYQLHNATFSHATGDREQANFSENT